MQKLDLDADTWHRLNNLLDEALDLPPLERAAWVSKLDSQHELLKPRLIDLLSRAADIETGDFMATLPKVSVAHLPTLDVRADQVGDTVGPYRLLRELGSGGMGTVWLAQRTDGMLNRPVALKLPHGAWRRAGLAERMAREREILATLEHPNIARLYDAGLASDGQPYLAIEYVEGQDIDAYCRDLHLDLKARLKLFAQVANAVAYAHAKLIVHRDLKPANILVTEDGQVRLLDFGIAKILEDGETKKTRLTELSGRALSLEYASPEQILGHPLSIATDVYSLGVVLYELLTGKRPYQLARDSRGALEDAILQDEPPMPSDAVDAVDRRLLRGDLDTVVLKALKKLPEARYATVNNFAEDIDRYLNRRPVLAVPSSRLYRGRRFVARNKVAVAAAFAIALSLVSGAALAIWQARSALTESQRAEQVKNFIVAIFADADPIKTGNPRVPSAVDLLRLATAKIERLESVRPEVRIELRDVLGASLLSVDGAADAEPVLRAAVQEATDVLGPLHLRTLHARRLLVRSLQVQDKMAAAEAEFQSLLPLLRQRSQSEPAELVAGLYEGARIASRRRRHAEAIDLAKEALAIVSLRLEDRSSHKVDLLLSLNGNYRQLGQFDAARDASAKAYSTAQELHPGELQHPTVVEARFYYAASLAKIGEFVKACSEYRSVFSDMEELHGAAGRPLALRLSAVATDFAQAGYLNEAMLNAVRAREILAAAYPQRNHRIEAAAAENIGRVANFARRGSLAVKELTTAVAGFRREYGARHQTTMDVQSALSLALAYAGRLPESEQAMAEVLEHWPRIPLDNFDVAAWNSGVRERLAGNHAAALRFQQQALDSARHPSMNALARARITTEMALNKIALGDYREVGAQLRSALATFESQQAEVTPDRADAFMALGRLELATGSRQNALPLLAKADAFWRDFDAESRWAGEAALWLGRCYLALGRNSDAHTALRRAEKILARSSISSDFKLVKLARERKAGMSPAKR